MQWNGKPLKKIITDKRLLRLCMDETQNTIYAIVVDEENGYELISISVPEIEWNGIEESEEGDCSNKGKSS